MHGEREQVPGEGQAGLPPFSARYPAAPPHSPAGERPLPPWSSEGHTVGGDAAEAQSAEEAPWTAEEAEALAEAGEDAPAPPAAIVDAFADEPWPGLEPEEEAEPEIETDQEEPWAATAGTAEDPWATGSASEADQAGSEPWAAAPPEETSEPWESADSGAGAETEPWAADREPEPLMLEEADQAGSWEEEAVATPEPAERAPTPLDELVDVAGEALAGASAWTETPLGTWPGEAEAWDTVALTGEEAAEPTVDDEEMAGIADALERLATDLRARGEAALDPASHTSLDAALAAFIAGWRAARRHG